MDSTAEYKTRLLARLDEIAASLQSGPGALALIGLGSVGLELQRLDQYSDLDFFVIVSPGYKDRYLDHLDWLDRICPVAYCFRNTPDGYKLLFEDGIFCEYAVFAPDELRAVPFAPGRVIWARAEFDASMAAPHDEPACPIAPSQEWLLGEALTNLYVGLGRYRRGERLSAMRFIQGYAVDRVLDLVRYDTDVEKRTGDPFAPERRVEARTPALAGRLAGFAQGYDRSPQSAAAILEYLEANYAVHPAMAAAVREMLV